MKVEKCKVVQSSMWFIDATADRIPNTEYNVYRVTYLFNGSFFLKWTVQLKWVCSIIGTFYKKGYRHTIAAYTEALTFFSDRLIEPWLSAKSKD